VQSPFSLIQLTCLFVVIVWCANLWPSMFVIIGCGRLLIVSDDDRFRGCEETSISWRYLSDIGNWAYLHRRSMICVDGAEFMVVRLNLDSIELVECSRPCTRRQILTKPSRKRWKIIHRGVLKNMLSGGSKFAYLPSLCNLSTLTYLNYFGSYILLKRKLKNI
jgi:hypothetical protein